MDDVRCRSFHRNARYLAVASGVRVANGQVHH
jgi:hypothetical protein